jgi:hypothetical protein
MAGIKAKIAIAALVLGLSAAWAQSPPRRKAMKKAPKPSAAQPAVQPVMPTPPPQPAVPLRPDQMAPSAPQVSYQDGQLSIVAQNSTLNAILAAVRTRTGAHIEMPADTVNDRVAVKLGPGNPRDVLASLLQGSRFDYIVLGSAVDSNAVSQVILTPHPGGGATQTAAVGSQPGPANPPAAMTSGGERGPQIIRGGAGRPEITSGDEDEQPTPDVQQPSQPEPQAPGAVMQPSPVQPTPGQPSPGGEVAQPPNPGAQNPNQPKSPEQLLQELQRMQQQQQQPKRPPQQPQQ